MKKIGIKLVEAVKIEKFDYVKKYKYKFAVKVVEEKGSPRTYDKKEELKKMGYIWRPAELWSAWIKVCETEDEIKEEIKKLNDMGFGSRVGVYYPAMGAFFTIRKLNFEEGIVDEKAMELRRRIYYWKEENNYR